jgi:Carboxypeptidase regulatory-like domain
MRLLLLLFTFAAFLPAESYSIAGTVVQYTSGAPVRHARVSVTPADGLRQVTSLFTGNNGQFSFTGLPAGKYWLAAEFRGHRQLFQEQEGFSTLIVTGPNLDSGHIVFALNGAASIDGTVVDEAGDPVTNAEVLLFRRAILSGRPMTVLFNSTPTDESGEFHPRDLIPGTYFVAVQGKPWFAQYQPRSANDSQLDVAYPLTYYSGSSSPTDATPVALADGAAAALHLTMHEVPALHIEFEGTRPGENPQLFQLGPGGTEIPASRVTYFTAGNTAELLGVAPGNYGIHFNGFRGGQLETSRKIAINLTSDTAINVDQPSKPNITGTLSLPEGHSPEVTVVLDNVANGQGALSSVAPDGSFQFEAAAGRYELQLADSGLYIKTLAVKGASYARGELDVSDGSNIQISITAAKGVSKVTGVATKNDQPFGGAMVLLIPRDFSHGAYIPRDQSDSDGTFALTAVPPGRYTLLAIEDGRELAYHDPAAIAPYLKQGQVIAVPLNTSQNPGTETKVEVQRQKP